MVAYSKLLTYSCYELGHTWDPSCSKCAFDMFTSAAVSSMKIYALVYSISAIASRMKFKKENLIKLLKDYIRSVLFLSINGSGFVGIFCVIRHLLGHVNYVTASWLPSFLASLCAIFIERKSRRSLLAIYVSNVASESLWSALVSNNVVKNFKFGQFFLFAFALSFFGLQYKLASNFSPFIKNLLKFFYGKKENISKMSIETRKNSENKIDGAAVKHFLCPHRNSCLSYISKAALDGGIKGIILHSCIQIASKFSTILRRPSAIFPILINSKMLRSILFFSWLGSSYKASCCAGRWIFNEEKGITGAVGGAISAMAILFCPSTSIATYAFWKALETIVIEDNPIYVVYCAHFGGNQKSLPILVLKGLYLKGMDAKILPNIPYGVELLYAFATAYLFHLAVLNRKILKPSYWKFLMTISDGRIAEYNRFLLSSYGADTFGQILPSYNPKFLSTYFLANFSRF